MPIENESLNEIIYKLSRHLLDSGRNVNLITAQFSSLDTNCARVDFAHELLTNFDLFPEVLVRGKSVEVARKHREEGNALFKSKQNWLAWKKYNESIANAPLESEDLALAYANRSAVLYEKCFFRECLKDIELAFSNNYPKQLHGKLLQRKQKAESSLELQPVQEKYFEDVPHLTYPPHPSIQCACDCIEIKRQQGLGRHIVATRDIRVGDIIAIERPFTQILLKDNYLTHCYECLVPRYNLIPCDNCVLVLFCTKTCKDNSCHKHECPILAALLDLGVGNLKLIALKISMLVDNLQFNNNTGTFYESGRYKEIHNLIGNTHLRSVSDLFERATKAAVIFELTLKHTLFFPDNRNDLKDIFKEILLLHIQTGPSNFHEISEMRVANNNSCEVTELGSGAYGFLSLLNHSCSPNVVRHCYGNAIVLRALRPISKGQQLFDNYGYHHAVMPKSDRRNYLKSQYYFDCSCEACDENWPLYQNLPVINFDNPIQEEALKLLGEGNRHVVNDVLKLSEYNAGALENSRPCMELADVHEIVKQCYAILGNKLKMF